MRRKPALFIALSLILIVMLILSSDVMWLATFASGLGKDVAESASPPSPYIFLNQTFDDEKPGTPPRYWNASHLEWGNLTVDSTTDCLGSGNSAKFVDFSNKSSPFAYREFPEKNGTIIISFAINLPSNTGNNTGLEVRVDDGNGNGANIIFDDGAIRCREKDGSLVTLRPSYIANRWYEIKFIIYILGGVYNIHIDEHLEVMGAKLTGSCSQINRIVLEEASTSTPLGSRQPIGYIDDLIGRIGIVIPTDFPTIQKGMDAATPGDVIIVSKNRVYFENVVINKNSTFLVGEDPSTTIIDGRFSGANPDRISVLDCTNVTIYGFTLSYSAANGAQINLRGSNNSIHDNIIISGLGDGIHIVGHNNTIYNNTVKKNLKCGIRIEGSNSTVTGNNISSSDECGIRIVGSNSSVANNNIASSLETGIYLTGSNSNITDNVIQSSLQIGVHIAGCKGNLVRNNTIQDNGVGLQCGINTNSSLIYRNRFVGNSLQASDLGTLNRWDNGYPHKGENETAGGNYWSDFNSIDVYSGPNQNEHGNCCLPLPDGICDQPYLINSSGTDHYPLFLIQGITQNPMPENLDCSKKAFVEKQKNAKSIDYTTNVTVTATTLKYVQIVQANLYVDYGNENGTAHGSIKMQIFGSILNGTIQRQRYATIIRYNVSALAYKASWVNSTSYPIASPYFVSDYDSPIISNPRKAPTGVDESQPVIVSAEITEPLNASQVNKVFVSYLVENATRWTGEMTQLPNTTYIAVIPRQPGGFILKFNITAVDNAGNQAFWPDSTYIRKLPQLLVQNKTVAPNVFDNPCSIDFGVVSGNQTYGQSFTIFNNNSKSDDSMGWNMSIVKGGPWLISVVPSGGVVPGGGNTTVTVTIDTRYIPDPSNYVVELSVRANGTVPQWAVIATLTVRRVVVDESWASSESPDRCNVDSIQRFGFHAKWANNCSDASGGTITVIGRTPDGRVAKSMTSSTDDTGWAYFTNSSAIPANITFRVEAVSFGIITGFVNKTSRTTIWDRVRIVLSIAREWIDVDSIVNISWNGSYHEVDTSPFRGNVAFNASLVHDDVGKWCISTLSITDYDYSNLSAFESNAVCCIWDEIKIIGGAVSHSQTNVGQTETVQFAAVYAYENKVFKGGNGTLFVNDDAMIWSNDSEVWMKNYTFDASGTRIFQVSGVDDNVHNLTKIKDYVGPLNIMWGSRYWWDTLWNTPSEKSVSQTETAQTHSPPTQPTDNSYAWSILVAALAVWAFSSVVAVVFLKSKKKNQRTLKQKSLPDAT